MADPVKLSLSVMLSVIQTIEKEVTKLDKDIEKLVKSILETLSTVKGIGPVCPPVSLLRSVKSIVSLTITLWLNNIGLVRSQHQSGEFESDKTRRFHW